MSFRFRHLDSLGSRVEVPIQKDERGHLGRECPAEDCEGYFTVRPGTGLTGNNLPCHCPYCGHKGSHDHFWTKDQIAHARSVATRQITDAFRRDLKQLEFNRPARGPFGIGVRMELKAGRPVPIRHYREKGLETDVVCHACTLEYAIYGVFAFCPDCGTHNSRQILEKNLDLVAKQVTLSGQVEDRDLCRHLLEDALENCVSAFDGFGRETCRIRAALSADANRAANLSFQNLPKAAAQLQALFRIDLVGAVAVSVWEVAHRAFLKRHVIAHRAGVVDEAYLAQTPDPTAVVGRRVPLTPTEVREVADVVRALGQALVALLPPPLAR